MSTTTEPYESLRTGTSVASIKQAILDNLYYVQGRTPELATPNDWYMAVAYTVRDRMLDRFLAALQGLRRPEVKIASYLSAEFLMGPHPAPAVKPARARKPSPARPAKRAVAKARVRPATRKTGARARRKAVAAESPQA